MQLQNTITDKLRAALAPSHLEVINESHRHSVPPNSETHFKVVIVSEQFAGQTLVQRHRSVNALLSDELSGGVHALGLHTMTDEEWQKRQGRVAPSPNCLGGSKAADG